MPNTGRLILAFALVSEGWREWWVEMLIPSFFLFLVYILSLWHTEHRSLLAIAHSFIHLNFWLLFIFWPLCLLVIIISSEIVSVAILRANKGREMEWWRNFGINQCNLSESAWIFNQATLPANLREDLLYSCLLLATAFFDQLPLIFERLVAISGFSTLQLMLRESEILYCLLNT